MKKLRLLLPLFVLSAGILAASPFEEVTSSDPLYQRVKALGEHGVLSVPDEARLTTGETVTRLELAAAVRTAERNAPIVLAAATGASVQPAAADNAAATLKAYEDEVKRDPKNPRAWKNLGIVHLKQGRGERALQCLRKSLELKPNDTQLRDFTAKLETRLKEKAASGETPKPAVAAAVPAPAPAEAPPPASALAASVSTEIDQILKLLAKEDAYLRARILADERELDAVSRGLSALEDARDAYRREWNKANRNSGSPNLKADSRSRFESLSTRGLQRNSIVTAGEEINVSLWADVGGRVSLSSGFGAYLPADNFQDRPTSIGVSSTRVDANLEGKLGFWKCAFLDTAYDSMTSFGDLTRSGGGGARRYEDPFNIKAYTSEKVLKNWNDYMSSIGTVETKDATTGQSTGDLVFDGVVFRGARLPYLPSDARLNLLAGRLAESQRFEYAAQYGQSLHGKKVTGSVACIFVQDSFGSPSSRAVTESLLDLRNYEATLQADLGPAMLVMDGAWSRIDTDYDALDPDATGTLTDVAARATLSRYPLNVHYQHVGPDYANFQSKVVLTSYDGVRYGIGENNQPGYVGESDVLASNRRGYVLNLGWDGRRTRTLRNLLPAFLDQMVLNANFARKREFRNVASNVLGSDRRTVDVSKTVDLTFPEWQGVWGSNLFGGWDIGDEHPMRGAYTANMQASSGVTNLYVSQYDFRSVSETFALVEPGTGLNVVNLREYRYLDMTQKWQINRWMKWRKPLYLGIYGGRTDVVARDGNDGVAPAGGTFVPAGKALFRRQVYDVALFFGNVLKNFHVMTHMAQENWESAYTNPVTDTRTRVVGGGVSWDVPWGASSKLEVRYNHVDHANAGVEANGYRGDQVIGLLKMGF